MSLLAELSQQRDHQVSLARSGRSQEKQSAGAGRILVHVLLGQTERLPQTVVARPFPVAVKIVEVADLILHRDAGAFNGVLDSRAFPAIARHQRTLDSCFGTGPPAGTATNLALGC